MKTTVFNCDVCQTEFPSDGTNPLAIEDNVLCEVKLSIRRISSHQSTTEESKHLCRKCLELIGLKFNWGGDERKSDHPTYKSLEDKFIEMLTEIGVKFEE